MTFLLNPFRYGAAAPTGVTDSFDRANSAVSMGNADTGQAWANLIGTWGISSNRAYSASGGSDDSCAIEAGATDKTVTATIVTRDAGTGVLARVQDSANYYLAIGHSNGNVQLYKKVATTYTQVGTTQAVAFADGHVLALKVLGTSLQVRQNGTLRIDVTDGALTTGTKAGLRAGAGTGRFDVFSVTLP